MNSDKTMTVECMHCGFENEVDAEIDYSEYDDEPVYYMSDEDAECEECGEMLGAPHGGMSDYAERMSERKQMGLSNF